MKRFLSVVLAAGLQLVLSADEPPRIEFEKPVRLMSEGKPLNQDEKLLFPSPVLLDLNQSGKQQLVVGDLWGKLRVYQPTGKKGDIAWGQGKNLQFANGKEFVIPNW